VVLSGSFCLGFGLDHSLLEQWKDKSQLLFPLGLPAKNAPAPCRKGRSSGMACSEESFR
jgi:hypothetical protein